MHQSPQKELPGRREKYAEFDPSDAQAERRLFRCSQPKARKFSLREDGQREPRAGGSKPPRN